MEEIDVIELLKRVKEGKAPKLIEIDDKFYTLRDIKEPEIEQMYYILSPAGYTVNWFNNADIYLDTKIKILDKPIIEELDTIIGDLENPTHNEMLLLNWIRNNRIKINETIKHINKEGK